jgi:transcriptional regulator with XRE-family HTH domain
MSEMLPGPALSPAEDTVTRRVSERVRTLRAERRWSARELAEACAREGMPSLNRSAISKIESGARKGITADEIAVLARALDVTPETLMSGDEEGVPGSSPESALAVPVPVVREPEHDMPLTQGDRSLLEDAMANLYSTEERAFRLLGQVGFPRQLIPSWRDGQPASDFWRGIFEELDRGAMRAPYRSLLVTALRTYSSRKDLLELQRRYLIAEPAAPPVTDPQQAAGSHAAQPPPDTCHLVAWVSADEERITLEAWLAERGLDPQLEWMTPTSVSFRLNQADAYAVDRVMSARRDLNWTVVAPGVPDYVLRYLSVQGPDGRSFRFNDVPSAAPIGSVASELVEQYGEGLPGADRPTIVEHVGPEGSRRLNPDSTLAEEGLAEGARLRVGFERRASPGFNPFYPVTSQDWLFSDEEREAARTALPGVRLAERKPHPFLTVIQLSAANASAVLELHLGYYVYYWRAGIGPDDFIRAIRERDARSGLALSLVWDSGEVEQPPEGAIMDLATGRASSSYSRSALIRLTGQDHSWVWQPGPLDVAGNPFVSPDNAYIVQASMANHAANFRAANEFLADSAIEGRQLARSTHLLASYLSQWTEASGIADAAMTVGGRLEVRGSGTQPVHMTRGTPVHARAGTPEMPPERAG